jgi:hypothetical protein
MFLILIQILHLCYDLACMIHSKTLLFDGKGNSSNTPPPPPPNQSSTTMGAVRFWTEQLKRAILVRYGPVGNNVNVVRQLLHHTKQVLRNKDGMDHVQYNFI